MSFVFEKVGMINTSLEKCCLGPIVQKIIFQEDTKFENFKSIGWINKIMLIFSRFSISKTQIFRKKGRTTDLKISL